MTNENQTAQDTANVTTLAEIADARLAEIADALRTCWDDLQPYSHPCDCMDVEAISASSVAQLIKAARQLIQDTRWHLAHDAGHPELAATGSICSACQEEQRQTTQGTIKMLDEVYEEIRACWNQMGVFVEEFSAAFVKEFSGFTSNERCRDYIRQAESLLDVAEDRMEGVVWSQSSEHQQLHAEHCHE